jgi:two-component system chemotaxis response regulator CheB
MQDHADLICHKIKVARHASIKPTRSETGRTPGTPVHAPLRSTAQVIAIGASTGGTEAIEQVVLPMPANSPRDRHHPAHARRVHPFLTERLDRMCHIRVSEAQGGERILPGHAFIAPGG